MSGQAWILDKEKGGMGEEISRKRKPGTFPEVGEHEKFGVAAATD